MEQTAGPTTSGAQSLLGQKIGNYRVVRPIGQGGMGAVFEAVHEYIERKAAIKVLHPELSQNPQFASRFLNEARAVNLVRHPGLVEIFEFGLLDDGTAYIVMEHLEGESLSQHIQRARGRLGGRALTIGRQVAQAMAAAHQKDIIHRDLKPDNVMLVADPERPGRTRVKVLDFGIAKMATPGEGTARTQTGTAVGTPEYMAPEQCLGLPDVDGKADVYALGIILYEMLSNRLPYDAELSFDFMAQHVRGTPYPLRQVAPAVPEAVNLLVEQMLVKNPQERPSMDQVVTQLERLETIHPATSSMPALQASSLPSPSSGVEVATAPTMAAPTAESQPATRKRRSWMLGVLLGVPAVLVAPALVMILMQRRPAPAPVQPRKVHWVLTSEPSKAEVVRADGQVLGTTPWEMEPPFSEKGETVVMLRLPGWESKTIALPHNADLKTPVALTPVKPAEPAAEKPAPQEEPAPAKAEARGKGKKRQKEKPQGNTPEKDSPEKVKLLFD